MYIYQKKYNDIASIPLQVIRELPTLTSDTILGRFKQVASNSSSAILLNRLLTSLIAVTIDEHAMQPSTSELKKAVNENSSLPDTIEVIIPNVVAFKFTDYHKPIINYFML